MLRRRFGSYIESCTIVPLLLHLHGPVVIPTRVGACPRQRGAHEDLGFRGRGGQKDRDGRPERFGFARVNSVKGLGLRVPSLTLRTAQKSAASRGSRSGTGFQPVGLTGWQPVPLKNDGVSSQQGPHCHYIRQLTTRRFERSGLVILV